MKKVLALLLALAMVFTFVACGAPQAPVSEAPASEAPAKDPVTLKVWESDKGPDQWIQQAGDAFTALHPEIKIEYVHVELGDSASQIALDGPAGVGPDLFAAPHDKLGELVSGGHVLPTANKDAVASKVVPAGVTGLTYDGTMYGYPTATETYALFYNKALIKEEELPKTWEDLKAFCAEFNNGDTYGFVFDVAAYYTILFTTSQDNRLFGATGADITSSNLNSPASVEGMKFMQSLAEVIKLPAADMTTATADASFAAGKAAMHISGPWNVQTFLDAGIDLGITTLPSLPGNSEPAASFSGVRGMFVSAYTDHAEEAALFAEFLLTDEMQALRNELIGSIPSTPISVESPYINGFASQMKYAFPMPSIPQMGAYWAAMDSASKNIWDGADVQTELDAANTAILAS